MRALRNQAPPRWEIVGISCRQPHEPAPNPNAEAVVIPTVTIEDVKRLGVPAATPRTYPATWTVTGQRTPLWAENPDTTLTTTLLGHDVEIELTPLKYAWSFGDGTSYGPTANPGRPTGPGQEPSLWHRFATPGGRSVTVTTTYSARYQVAGQPWLDVAGTANATSAPLNLTVWTTKRFLVADTCEENPTSPGCQDE